MEKASADEQNHHFNLGTSEKNEGEKNQIGWVAVGLAIKLHRWDEETMASPPKSIASGRITSGIEVWSGEAVGLSGSSPKHLLLLQGERTGISLPA